MTIDKEQYILEDGCKISCLLSGQSAIYDILNNKDIIRMRMFPLSIHYDGHVYTMYDRRVGVDSRRSKECMPLQT